MSEADSGAGRLPGGISSSMSVRPRMPQPVASQLPSLKSLGTGSGLGTHSAHPGRWMGDHVTVSSNWAMMRARKTSSPVHR